MLLVLIYHSIIFWTGGWFIIEPTQKIRLLGILSFFLGESHIYAFVLVSGYIFAYSIDERGKYKKFGPFFKDKIKKLMVPYVFVLLVWVIPNACFFFHFDAAAILHRFLLGESPNQWWFILMLFHVFIIQWYISKTGIKNLYIGFIVSVICYIAGHLCILTDNTGKILDMKPWEAGLYKM